MKVWVRSGVVHFKLSCFNNLHHVCVYNDALVDPDKRLTFGILLIIISFALLGKKSAKANEQRNSRSNSDDVRNNRREKINVLKFQIENSLDALIKSGNFEKMLFSTCIFPIIS